MLSFSPFPVGHPLCTIPNFRFSPRFGHPGNWGLRIVDLRPSDAGVYLCQISTFPTKVNVVNLKVTGRIYSARAQDGPQEMERI